MNPLELGVPLCVDELVSLKKRGFRGNSTTGRARSSTGLRSAFQNRAEVEKQKQAQSTKKATLNLCYKASLR
jgi:hypothetical protein